jgi:hypothetical protein
LFPGFISGKAPSGCMELNLPERTGRDYGRAVAIITTATHGKMRDIVINIKTFYYREKEVQWKIG